LRVHASRKKAPIEWRAIKRAIVIEKFGWLDSLIFLPWL
jgi:hypothetical protein